MPRHSLESYTVTAGEHNFGVPTIVLALFQCFRFSRFRSRDGLTASYPGPEVSFRKYGRLLHQSFPDLENHV
jgi:hypothetical protein